MKRVHDIVTTTDKRTTVSFVQHGNVDDGYVYELVCPWCASAVHKLSTHPEVTWGEVLNAMKVYQEPIGSGFSFSRSLLLV